MPRQPLTTLADTRYDVAIIGAGINGASTAQHLAAAGYSVLLVDKADFGAGSSSRSSRLLHCGLRYFETPRPLIDFTLAPRKLIAALRLARDAMHTRAELVRTAAARLRPITMLFPVYRDGPYSAWQLDLAFKLLTRFGPPDVPLNYKRLKPDAARHLPFIAEMRDPDRLHSVATYREFMFDWPERFVIDAVLDAERLGATVRNYTSAALGPRDAGGTWQLTLTDTLGAGDTATVRATAVLNLAGIWIDRVNAGLDAPPKPLIFGTKGAHLVVGLPATHRDFGIATLNTVGEPHYLLPSQGGCHHIGPTETVFTADEDTIAVDANDRAFLLDQTARILPGLNIADDDIRYTWAGVRPLGRDPAFEKGSRAAELHDLTTTGHPGLYAYTAGPIMTHRTAARLITDKLQQTLKPSGQPRPLDYTPRDFPPAPNSPPLIEGDTTTVADLAHAAKTEHTHTLTDILIARTGLAYRHVLTAADIRRAANVPRRPHRLDPRANRTPDHHHNAAPQKHLRHRPLTLSLPSGERAGERGGAPKRESATCSPTPLPNPPP